MDCQWIDIILAILSVINIPDVDVIFWSFPSLLSKYRVGLINTN